MDAIVRMLLRSCVFPGDSDALFAASMNLADVPNNVMPVASAKSKSTLPSGWNGEPS